MQLDTDLPTSRKHMWATTLAVAAFLLTLYWFDVFFTDYFASKDGTSTHAPIIKSLLENMIAGAAAAFALAVCYRWILQKIDPADRVIEVTPEWISDRLTSNARKTGSYIFIGNTATFVAAAILPVLVARARKTGRTINGKLFIIDPRDRAAIDAYTTHKGRTQTARSGGSDEDLASWVRPSPEASVETPLRTRAKLYACIYLCAYAARSSGISLDLYLRRSFTPFRADISDREVILTQESGDEAAVAFSSRGHFYGWYHKEAEALETQCAAIRFTAMKELRGIQLAHPSQSRDAIRDSLLQLLSRGLPGYEFSMDSEELEATVERIIRPSHAYQR